SPLFQVLFSLQNWEDNGDQAIDLEGLELSLYESELNTKAQFDLLMSAKREASHISFHLVYRTSLYKKSSIINMLSHYKELLRDIVCNPGSRLGDLTLLRTIEKEELLVRSTGFFSAIPEVTIMDLFDSQ
ncbi:hypothetical protein J9332_37575, partial [Aquimarina celericrescens]|nr:hypothetical protein [Aquimarina celericrescens]